MATSRVTISKTSDGWYRVVCVEKYSTPWYYGETAAQALRGAPIEIRAHAARLESLISRPDVSEVVIKNLRSHIEVECIHGEYRRVIPAVSTDVRDALDKILSELEANE